MLEGECKSFHPGIDREFWTRTANEESVAIESGDSCLKFWWWQTQMYAVVKSGA